MFIRSHLTRTQHRHGRHRQRFLILLNNKVCFATMKWSIPFRFQVRLKVRYWVAFTAVLGLITCKPLSLVYYEVVRGSKGFTRSLSLSILEGSLHRNSELIFNYVSTKRTPRTRVISHSSEFVYRTTRSYHEVESRGRITRSNHVLVQIVRTN